MKEDFIFFDTNKLNIDIMKGDVYSESITILDQALKAM